MSLHIEQIVFCVCQLADDLLVADGVIICILNLDLIKLNIVGLVFRSRLPLTEFDLALSRLGFVFFDIQLEHPVALQIIGTTTGAVSLRILGFQQVIGAQRQLAEVDHALVENIVILVLEFGCAIRGYDRIGRGPSAAAPAHELRIAVFKGRWLAFPVKDRGVDRKGRAGQLIAVAVYLHKGSLIIVADILDAHGVDGQICAQHRLVILIQRENTVVLAGVGRITGNQRGCVNHIERAAILPQVFAGTIRFQIRCSDQHQVSRVILLEAGGDRGLLHIVGAHANGGKLHCAFFKELALSVCIVLPIRGGRCRHTLHSIPE